MYSNCENCSRKYESSSLLAYWRGGARYWVCFDCYETLPEEAADVAERSTFDG